MSYFAQRRDKLRRLMKEHAADGMLVTDFTNVSYLTGFTGDDSFLLLKEKKELLITDKRYTEQLETECPDLELIVREPGETMTAKLAAVLQSAKVKNLAVEADNFTMAQLNDLLEQLSTAAIVGTKGLVLQLREIKDKEEIELIRIAIRIAERAFGVVKATLRNELTEKQIGDEIDRQIRLFGGTGCSFTPIVGVGPRAALPHGRPGPTQLAASSFVLIDWGARANGYISDLTRVLMTEQTPAKMRKIYDVVLAANEAGIKAIRPGAIMADVDAAARQVIEKAGFGKQFGHSLGHGIGMQVHEQPRLAIGQDRPLKAGMVVTVEPGIYIPGLGGVRIEDDVLVTKNGHEVLTSVPKQAGESLIQP